MICFTCEAFFVRFTIDTAKKTCSVAIPPFVVFTPPFVMKDGAVFVNTSGSVEQWQWKDCE